MDAIRYLLLFFLATKNLKYYRRRHFKLFTNCHVLWDTLYVDSSTAVYKILESLLLHWCYSFIVGVNTISEILE